VVQNTGSVRFGVHSFSRTATWLPLNHHKCKGYFQGGKRTKGRYNHGLPSGSRFWGRNPLWICVGKGNANVVAPRSDEVELRQASSSKGRKRFFLLGRQGRGEASHRNGCPNSTRERKSSRPPKPERNLYQTTGGNLSLPTTCKKKNNILKREGKPQNGRIGLDLREFKKAPRGQGNLGLHGLEEKKRWSSIGRRWGHVIGQEEVLPKRGDKLGRGCGIGVGMHSRIYLGTKKGGPPIPRERLMWVPREKKESKRAKENTPFWVKKRREGLEVSS